MKSIWNSTNFLSYTEQHCKMESIRELTNTINVFVRFFESINCLFWQIDWLRRNVQSTGSEQMAIVLILLVLCIYLTFFSNSNFVNYLIPMLGKNVNSILVGVIIIGLVIWLVYLRLFRSSTIQLSENKDRMASTPFLSDNDSRNTVAPFGQYSHFPSTRFQRSQV